MLHGKYAEMYGKGNGGVSKSVLACLWVIAALGHFKEWKVIICFVHFV